MEDRSFTRLVGYGVTIIRSSSLFGRLKSIPNWDLSVVFAGDEELLKVVDHPVRRLADWDDHGHFGLILPFELVFEREDVTG